MPMKVHMQSTNCMEDTMGAMVITTDNQIKSNKLQPFGTVVQGGKPKRESGADHYKGAGPSYVGHIWPLADIF